MEIFTKSGKDFHFPKMAIFDIFRLTTQTQKMVSQTNY